MVKVIGGRWQSLPEAGIVIVIPYMDDPRWPGEIGQPCFADAGDGG